MIVKLARRTELFSMDCDTLGSVLRWLRYLLILVCLAMVTNVVLAPFNDTYAFDLPPTTGDDDDDDDNGDDPDSCDDNKEKEDGDPINLTTGAEHYKIDDLQINGLYTLTLTRRYNSRIDYDSALGYGWGFNTDRRLYEYSDGSVVIRYGCGRRADFVYTGGAYVTPPGHFRGASLVQNPDGTFVLEHNSGEKNYFDTVGRITAMENITGHRWEFEYDSRGELPLIGTSPYAVDPTQPMIGSYHYRLLQIKERAADGNITGRYIQFTYDEATGRLQSLTTHDGRTITYQHDVLASATSGNLIQVNGLEGVVSTYQYTDPNDPHNLTYIEEGAGSTPYVTTYDTSDRAIHQVHGNHVIDITYPVANAETRVTNTITDDQGLNPQTYTTIHNYDINGYMTQFTDAQGHQIHRTPDANGRTTRKEIWHNNGTTLELLQAVDYTYDTAGNRTSETVTLDSGEVITKSRTYDGNQIASEQVVSSADSGKIFQTVTVWNHGPDGKPTTIQEVQKRKDDGSYQVTAYTYDSLNRKLTETLPDGHVIAYEYTGDYLTRVYHKDEANEIPQLQESYAYDARGNKTQITDARGNSTQLVYDERNRLSSVIKANGEEDHYSYDFSGNLILLEKGRTVAEGEGQVVRLNYNNENRLVSIEQKNDAGVFIPQVSYTYDSDGNRITQTDGENNTSTFTYEIVGGQYSARLKTVTDASGNTTTFEYDAAGNQVVVVDANLNETRYVYDDLNRVISVDQLGITPSAVSAYTYDANNNIKSVTDPENNTTTYEYDALSRLIKVTQPMLQEMQYSYDERNRLIATIYARGHKITYGYETWGPLSSVHIFASTTATTPLRTTSYTYDNAGNLLSVSDDSIQAGPLYSMSYDVLNRPDVTTINYIPGGVKTLDYNYDRFGNKDGLVLNDGAIHNHSYTYNKLNQLTTAALPGGQTFGLTYYANNQPQTLTAPSGVNTNYNYYPNGPVQNISTINSTPTTIEQLAYTYDPTLNVDTLTDNDGLHDFSYDGIDRLTQALHPASTGLAAEDYAYDLVGNREDPNDANLYDYDANNRVVQSPGLTYSFDDDGNMLTRSDGASFIYDEQNRLIQYNKDSATVTYTYDPIGRRINKTVNGVTTWYLWESMRLLAEFDSSGTRTQRYAYLPYYYAPVQTEDSNGIYIVHSDLLGTPRFLTGTTEQVVWRHVQKAFGEATINEDVDGNGTSVSMNIRLPGQYYDQETGLHYNYFRYYDPSIGRYITSDPTGLGGGLNQFSYAEENPTGITDFYGLKPRGGGGRVIEVPSDRFIPPNMDPMHPKPAGPQKPFPPNFPCIYDTMGCYREIVCDYDCYNEDQCGPHEPVRITGVYGPPPRNCVQVGCYWKYK